MKNEFNYDIYTLHEVYNKKGEIVGPTTFNISDESDGTRSLFAIASLILIVLEDGKVFVIDEMEQNIHPLLVNVLIKLFQNPRINKKNAQLICTTHNAHLLEDDIYRRDQVWFTEKDEKGETTLYSLADIEGVRNNIPLGKWYLSGRFGATPIVNDIKFIYGNDTQKKK
ncbi:MAG: ATP-binding protein [Bacteroidia bacterium]|nr:ATP-binding protein [Bacteroidia bacterium]